MFRVGILIASDKGARGEREDLSGKLIEEIVVDFGYEVVERKIVPDDYEDIKSSMIHMVDDLGVDLLLTTGGTGFSPRDITPEVTEEVCTRMANGIAEAIRSYSLSITPRAMLSRAVSGIRKQSLIVNLPGSPKAVKEALDYALESIDHGLEILTGRASDCARK